MPAPSEPAPLQFAPVIVEPASALQPTSPRPKRARRRNRGGDIELEIGGIAVRVERGADAKTVAAVIRALKAEP
jgi:transposase